MGLLGLDDRAHPGRRPRPVNALCRHPARLASPKWKSTVRSARTHAPALRACVPTWRWWPKSPTTSSIIRIVRPSRHDVARLHGSGPAELRGVAQSSCPAGGDGELSGAAGGAGWRRLRRDCPPLASPSQNPSQSRLRLVAHRQRCRPRLCGGGSSLLTTASGTPPNCELRGRGLQLPLNNDSGRLRRKTLRWCRLGETHHRALGAEPHHEPRAGPEFESVHSGRDRPRSRDFSCATDASVDGRNAQIPAIRRGLGERVNSVEDGGRDAHC
jgi:hypothetical protein